MTRQLGFLSILIDNSDETTKIEYIWVEILLSNLNHNSVATIYKEEVENIQFFSMFFFLKKSAHRHKRDNNNSFQLFQDSIIIDSF